MSSAELLLKTTYIFFIIRLDICNSSMVCILCLDSGREAEKLAYITKYLKAVAMFRDYNDVSQDPDFTQVSHDAFQF